jgi:hypothetical protein
LRQALSARRRAKPANKREEQAQDYQLRIAKKDAYQRHHHTYDEHPNKHCPRAERIIRLLVHVALSCVVRPASGAGSDAVWFGNMALRLGFRLCLPAIE